MKTKGQAGVLQTILQLGSDLIPLLVMWTLSPFEEYGSKQEY